MSANIDLTTTCRSYLKKKIIKNNLLEYKCSECGLKDSWNCFKSFHPKFIFLLVGLKLCQVVVSKCKSIRFVIK